MKVMQVYGEKVTFTRLGKTTNLCFLMEVNVR